MGLLRIFIPSWRLFDELGTVSVLFYRSRSSSTGYGPWTQALCPPPPRRFWNLLLNPQGNLYLAFHALVQHFLTDLHDTPTPKPREIKSLMSYRLVCNLVREQIQQSKANVSACYFQFRIDLNSDPSGKTEFSTCFQSQEDLSL